MKIRKEFLIFGAIVLVLIGIIIAVSTLGNSRSHYNGDDVVLNFGDDINSYESSDIGEDFVDDYIYDPYADETDEDLNDDVIQWDDAGDPLPSQAQDVYDESGYIGSEAYEIMNENADVGEDEGAVRPRVLEPERLSADEYVDMLIHFVCGVEDERYTVWLTGDLLDTFNTRLTEEPYLSLYGDTKYSDVSITDTSFSFKSSYGTTYRFAVGFNGDTVSYVIPQ